jgi:hypothetical protein
VRCEAAEDDGVDGAKPGAGEHRLQRFGHHRHVDDDAVALFDPLGLERPGKAGHAVLQLGVGDDVLGARDRAVMDDRGLLAAPGEDVAVDGVPAGVDLGVGEPFVKRGTAVIQRAGGWLHPVDAPGGGKPEPLRVLLPLAVNLRIAHRDLPPLMLPLRHVVCDGVPVLQRCYRQHAEAICRIC